MKTLHRSRVPACAAVAMSVAGLAVAAFAGTAVGHSESGAKTEAAAHGGLGLSPSLMKSARWITLKDGQKVYGVPLTIRVSGGKLLAHPASYGACTYCSAHANYGSGQCMSSYPNTQGSPIEQYTCNNSANQEWIYASWTDNEPYLFAYNTNHLCLNNYGFSFSNGNKMALWSCNSGSVAMWFGEGASNYSGYVLIHLFASYQKWSNQCVTVLPNRPPGSAVEEWTCDRGSTWQAFNGLWDGLAPPGAADRP